MKNYQHIAQRLYSEPWLITKEKHDRFVTLFEAHIAGNKVFFEDDSEDDDDDSAETRISGQTMIIPVHGVLGKHLSNLEMACGGCSVDKITSELDKAEANYQVKNIVLDFRSPGGVVTGIPELAKRIGSLSKDVYAFTDIECCSAALWLASKTDAFYCTESAVVGSCGVYSIYLDRSKQLAEAGLTVNAISSGEFKLAGASFKPMSDRERSMLQAQCDDIHTKFIEAVQENHDVSLEFLQGQVYYGEEAADIGMADELVDCLDDLLEMVS